jgi:hypothetical protein
MHWWPNNDHGPTPVLTYLSQTNWSLIERAAGNIRYGQKSLSRVGMVLAVRPDNSRASPHSFVIAVRNKEHPHVNHFTRRFEHAEVVF